MSARLSNVYCKSNQISIVWLNQVQYNIIAWVFASSMLNWWLIRANMQPQAVMIGLVPDLQAMPAAAVCTMPVPRRNDGKSRFHELSDIDVHSVSIMAGQESQWTRQSPSPSTLTTSMCHTMICAPSQREHFFEAEVYRSKPWRPDGLTMAGG